MSLARLIWLKTTIKCSKSTQKSRKCCYCNHSSRATRPFASSLLCAIIAHYHLPFFKIFSNFVHFYPNFQIFCLFCPFLTFFCSFCPFSEIARLPLLSRIGPGDITDRMLLSLFERLYSILTMVCIFLIEPYLNLFGTKTTKAFEFCKNYLV